MADHPLSGPAPKMAFQAITDRDNCLRDTSTMLVHSPLSFFSGQRQEVRQHKQVSLSGLDFIRCVCVSIDIGVLQNNWTILLPG